MRSLFIGNVDDAVKEVIKYFDSQVDKKFNDIYRKKKLNYKKLFFSKKYDNVFYFAENFDDVDDLNNFLQIVDNSSDVKKYVYIVRGNKFNIDCENEKIDIIREIFDGYSKKRDKNIIFLNVSCLYGKKFIDGEINNIKNKKKYKDIIANYIHIDDFSKYLYLIGIHRIENSYIEFKGDISVNLLSLLSKRDIVTVKEDNNYLFDYKFDHSIIDDINSGDIIDFNKKEDVKRNVHPVIRLLEILVMFFVSEYLINVFNTIFNLQYIDFRLIFMIIIAIYYEFKYSLFATVLVILSFIFTNINSSYDLSMIISNTDNWIAIIIYLIMTIVIRNKIKKYENMNENANEMISSLINDNKHKDRNIKKYEMKIKELNKELITHNNSFSRVSMLISDYKKIDIEQVYEIFVENLDIDKIMVLDYLSDKIYTKYDINYNKSLDKKIKKIVFKNDVWVNNELDDKMPMYIVPIFSNKELIYLVTIWDCDVNMINNEYRNNLISLAKIVSFLKECEK